MPLPPTLFLLCAAAAVGLLSGLLGGLGGRALQRRAWERQLDDVFEELAALRKRLSKREGSAGLEVRAANESRAQQEAEAIIAAASGAKGRAPLSLQLAPKELEPEDLDAAAARYFAKGGG